jgi:hypothetical protein
MYSIKKATELPPFPELKSSNPMAGEIINEGGVHLKRTSILKITTLL